MLLCHITSQVATDKDQSLLQDKGGRGFPYLAYLDAEGAVIAKQGARSVDAFEATGKKVKRYVDLRKKADGGDKGALVDVTIVAAELGQFAAEEGRKKLGELAGVTPDQKKTIDAVLVNYDVQDAAKALNPRDKATLIDAGRKFAAWKKEGRLPSWDNEIGTFHSCIMELAESEKDAKLFEESLEAIKTHFGKNINPRFLEAKAKILEQLKAEKK